MSKILVTGAAGFIGFSLAMKLIEEGHEVVGIDNLNDYYDPDLKRQRIERLIFESSEKKNFKFVKLDLKELLELNNFLKDFSFDFVYHFAAQAGVRYSFENPVKYFESNVVGTFNLIEILRNSAIKRFIFSSTSSVYGNSLEPNVSEMHKRNPIQFYAATKEIDELMCKMYSEVYNIKTTVFRFFTVYGPWGRPDMALFKFVKSIINKHPIEIYNNGDHRRSFTYIDDVIFYLIKVMQLPSEDKYEVYNLGNPVSVDLLEFIKIIEDKLAITAEKIYLPLQFGDVHGNLPSIEKLTKKFGEKNFMNVETGISNFIDWYKSHYH